MTTWILILTIAMPAHGGGVSVASVPGFGSQASCAAAAESWLRGRPDSTSASALCVRA